MEPGACQGLSVHSDPHDHSVLCNFLHRCGGQRGDLHSDLQEQAHAHGHQLLSVQPRRVGPSTTCVWPSSGDVLHLVQIPLRVRGGVLRAAGPSCRNLG